MFSNHLVLYYFAIERQKELLREAEQLRMAEALRRANRLERQSRTRYAPPSVCAKECLTGFAQGEPRDRSA